MTALPALGDLNAEILLLICEQLYIIEPKSFSRLRHASRILNELATPFIYRNFQLRSKFLEAPSETFLRDALQVIHYHVQHVTIEGMLDWDLAAQFLTKCRRLKTLTWDNDVRHRRHAHFPKSLKKVFEDLPDVGLSIHKCVYDQNVPGAVDQLRSIPAANLVSFEVSATGQSGYYTSPHAFQEFLVASTRLEDLKFRFLLPFHPESGKLPPIKSLALPTRSWDYSPKDVERIWNFSRLQDLDIPGHLLCPFLKSVPPEDLHTLKRLRVDDSCWPSKYLDPVEQYAKQESLTQLLSRLLQNRYDFQELDIRCLLGLFEMSLVTKQGQFLKALILLDLAGFEEEGIFPTISLSDLMIIQHFCTRITKLDIGINIIGGETTNFLKALSGFRALQDLTVYTQSKLTENNVDTIVEDIDRRSAIEIKNTLVPMKQGVPLSRLGINVGGWRQAGRNGPPPYRGGWNWDRRQSQGRNAERMFVFERDHKDDFLFREHRNPQQKPWPLA